MHSDRDRLSRGCGCARLPRVAGLWRLGLVYRKCLVSMEFTGLHGDTKVCQTRCPVTHFYDMNFRAFAPLDSLSVLSVTGADASRFLQGQVSADVAALRPGEQTLAGLHNPQGRAIAVPRILAREGASYWMVLPTDLADTVRMRLQRYVLRAKLSLTDASAEQRVLGVWEGSQRQLSVQAVSEPDPAGIRRLPQDWWLADIADGMPQIFTATSEQFTAQMLNLDLTGGVSFTKGCYTGQEVVARSHYRGRAKRRLQAFATGQTELLQAGERRQLVDGRSLDVLYAAARAEGGQHFLAVAPLALPDSGLEHAATTALLEAQALQLPYALPLAVSGDLTD